MYVDDPLAYISPTWKAYDPRVSSAHTLHDLLGIVLDAYLYFFPAPRRPVTRSIADVNVSLAHLGLSATSMHDARDKLSSYAWHLLFDDDIEIAALYTALLLTDLEKAKSIKSIDKAKVLAFFGDTSVLSILQRLLAHKISLPPVQPGIRYIGYSYWKDHCNVFEGDLDTVYQSLKAVHEMTHLSLSYLIEHAQVSCTEEIVLGFKV